MPKPSTLSERADAVLTDKDLLAEVLRKAGFIEPAMMREELARVGVVVSRQPSTVKESPSWLMEEPNGSYGADISTLTALLETEAEPEESTQE